MKDVTDFIRETEKFIEEHDYNMSDKEVIKHSLKNEKEMFKTFKKEKEKRCFAELLEVIPENYRNVKLTRKHFLPSVVLALHRDKNIDTVCDLLYLSPYELMRTRDIGEVRFDAIVKALKSYCKNNKGEKNNVSQ